MSTIQLVTFANVKIYFGIYTFFKSAAFPVTDFIAFVVLAFRKS